MSKQFKRQRQWVNEILDRFGELQKSQPCPFREEPNWPEWVDNLFLVLLGISHSGVKLKNIKKWKAKDLGKLLGRQYAGERLTWGQVRLSPLVIKEGLMAGSWGKQRVKQLNPDFDMKAFQKKYEREVNAWQPIFKKFIKDVLASACERPYHETSAFFEAFGKSIVMKPDDLLTERTIGVGDKICVTMIMMWREISQLRSVAELHRVFERALKPHGIIVRYKRIEKLCQRIGLKFKGPGRPTGKTQTNLTAV